MNQKKSKRSSRNRTSGKYKRQFFRSLKNLERRWKKHLEIHPKDKQAKGMIEQKRKKKIAMV